MKKLFPLVFLLLSGLLWLGCEDDLILCEGGLCATEEECIIDCEEICVDGEYDAECTFDGNCLCECFLGCL